MKMRLVQGDSFVQHLPSSNFHPSQLQSCKRMSKRNEGQHFAVNSWLSENFLWTERIATTIHYKGV